MQEKDNKYGMTNKVIMVLFSGVMFSGKTTAAGFVINEISQENIIVRMTSFAAKIKEVAYKYFFWDGVKDERGRKLLQKLGTEVGREYYEDMWCRHLDEAVNAGVIPPNFVLVDDWRFPNELSYFKSKRLYDTVTVRIERDSLPKSEGDLSNHRSEISLPHGEAEKLEFSQDGIYNFVIHNDGSIKDLETKLSGLVSYLKNKII